MEVFEEYASCWDRFPVVRQSDIPRGADGYSHARSAAAIKAGCWPPAQRVALRDADGMRGAEQRSLRLRAFPCS